MKTKIVILTVLTGLMTWGCSKIQDDVTLRQALQNNVADVNSAISKISATKGYEMLTVADNPAKSGTSFNDSITLKMIAGIYDFQPSPFTRNNVFFPFRLFKKSGTSDKLIVNLPEKLIFHPKYLVNTSLGDSVLNNNFTITASDYHYYYNWWNSYDYKLTAGLTLDNDPLGSIEMTTISSKYGKISNLSRFTFKEGYTLSAEWINGDTTTSSIDLMKGDEILLKESNEFIRSFNHQGERKYSLIIGDIEIRRMSGVDSIQVYLNGILQKQAGAVITDSNESTGTICGKRDILLTFDDGTTAKLSEMISPAMKALRSLVDSLHSMYFARNIADYVAMSIYYNTH